MKSGANRVDQARIARLALGNEDEGIKPLPATAISKVLNIELSCVKAFMPKKPRAKPAPKG